MVQEKDQRRRVVARIHAKATAVERLVELSRLYGVSANSKKVNGTVQEVLVDQVYTNWSTSLPVECISVN